MWTAGFLEIRAIPRAVNFRNGPQGWGEPDLVDLPA